MVTMYDWRKVAARTERVYRDALQLPPKTLADRFRGALSCGPVAGKVGLKNSLILVVVVVVMMVLLLL